MNMTKLFEIEHDSVSNLRNKYTEALLTAELGIGLGRGRVGTPFSMLQKESV